MEEKIICSLPLYSTAWESLLKGMMINESKHFQNLGNSLHNARCAIVRYYGKVNNGKAPYRHFRTESNRADQTFSITRTE